jgi:predicted metalloprotease
MRWRPGAGGGNVEDRRGRTGGRAALPVGGGLVGVVVTVLILLLGGGGGYGVDSPFEQFPSQSQPASGANRMETAPDAESQLVDFVSFVIGDLQKFWAADFQRAGRDFEPTRLVLFRQATDTGCGQGSSQTGPFYCPIDRQIYVDLGFFRELAQRFQAPGDFAQAYVLAHEYGHHVQTLTTVTQQVDQASREDPDQRNALSVRVELQADCLAGVWAHSTFERGLLEQGDLEEGLTAAASVGDDRIQAETTGRISPETFTHGTAEQRASWFKRGFDEGDAGACDTFSGDL